MVGIFLIDSDYDPRLRHPGPHWHGSAVPGPTNGLGSTAGAVAQPIRGKREGAEVETPSEAAARPTKRTLSGVSHDRPGG